MNEQQTLQELWALPVNMKPLPYDFFGKKLYSSDKLKLKFFEAILSTPWGKHHAKNLQRLVQKNYIVPVIMTKGLLGFLSKKFLTKDWTKNLVGVYYPDLDKVFVFIDNSSTWMGLSSNKTLVKTTLHETMHLSAIKNKSGFFKVMQKTLKKYYENYYKEIFSCKKLNMDKVIKIMLQNEGEFYPSKHNKFIKALTEAVEPVTTMDEDAFLDRMQDINMVTRSFPISPQLIMRYYPRFYHLFGPLNTAYMQTFGERNKYTTPVQELWSLSEVASVMVELLPVDRRVSMLLSNIK